MYSEVVSTPEAVYLVGLAKSFASYTVHIIALSPSTGELLSSVDVPSSIRDGPSELLVLSNKNQIPHIAWLQDGRIHSLKLTHQLKEKASVTKGAVYKKLIDVKLCEDGQFVGIKEDGSGRVVKLTDEGALKVTWEFENSVREEQCSRRTLLTCIMRRLPRTIIRNLCIPEAKIWTVRHMLPEYSGLIYSRQGFLHPRGVECD